MFLNGVVGDIAEIYMAAKEVLLGHLQEAALQPAVAKVFPLSESADVESLIGTSEKKVAWPESLKPHLSNTRIEAALCLAT